jgi:hypothetical protein
VSNIRVPVIPDRIPELRAELEKAKAFEAGVQAVNLAIQRGEIYVNLHIDDLAALLDAAREEARNEQRLQELERMRAGLASAMRVTLD